METVQVGCKLGLFTNRKLRTGFRLVPYTENGDLEPRNGRYFASFLPRCIECRRGLAMRILSVRPSVRLSVRHTHGL